jgi:Zn-dependent metalloprotease
MKTYYRIAVVFSIVLFLGRITAVAQSEKNSANGKTHQVVAARIPVQGITIQKYGYAWETLTEAKVEEFGKKLIDKYSQTLHISSSQVKKRRIWTDGDWMVDFDQIVNGIPVEGSDIGFTINKNGSLLLFASKIYQGVDIPIVPSITSAKAIEISMKDAGVRPSLPTFLRDTALQSLQANPPVQLVIFPQGKGDSTTYTLTWDVKIIRFDHPMDFQYYIDAHTGNILWKINGGSHLNYDNQNHADTAASNQEPSKNHKS